MKRVFLSLYVLLFALLFVAPVLQNFFGFFPPRQLDGVEYSAELPKFALKSWLDDSFQNNFGSWYDKVYGMRDYFVRTENQINYTLFHEITGGHIVLGKQETMYEDVYILDVIGFNKVTTEQMEQAAIKLRKLQDFLNNRGIAFLFIITPSKARIYPEYLPDHVLKLKKGQDVSNYDKLLPFLDKYGVHYLDGHAYSSSLKQDSCYPVFCRGGTHWNYYSAYLFTREIMARLEMMIGKPLCKLEGEKVTFLEKPIGSDDDLARLANLWDTSPFIKDIPYPEVVKVPVADAVQPDVLFVGGSFVYTILHWLNDFEIIDKSSDFYYYFSQKKISDMQKEILSRDAVILETNEQALAWLGFGFPEEVLNHSQMTANLRDKP